MRLIIRVLLLAAIWTCGALATPIGVTYIQHINFGTPDLPGDKA